MFLPREFRDLGGEDQVLRVLRILVREKRLVPGSATVSTAVPSSRAFPGDPILYSPSGFIGASWHVTLKQYRSELRSSWRGTFSQQCLLEVYSGCRQALTKLGVKWEPSDARWLISEWNALRCSPARLLLIRPNTVTLLPLALWAGFTQRAIKASQLAQVASAFLVALGLMAAVIIPIKGH